MLRELAWRRQRQGGFEEPAKRYGDRAPKDYSCCIHREPGDTSNRSCSCMLYRSRDFCICMVCRQRLCSRGTRRLDFPVEYAVVPFEYLEVAMFDLLEIEPNHERSILWEHGHQGREGEG